MKLWDWLKLSLGIALVATAGFLFLRGRGGRDLDRTFFYDQSQQKLFVGARTAVPPIKGLDNNEPDAVRAVVISPTGKPEDKSSWKIAYLEKYSAELKQQMESAQATGTSPKIDRQSAMAHRFVRRVNDTNWFAMNTDEAQSILNELVVPGPNGATPVVCSP
jgi:hypothetical protein